MPNSDLHAMLAAKMEKHDKALKEKLNKRLVDGNNQLKAEFDILNFNFGRADVLDEDDRHPIANNLVVYPFGIPQLDIFLPSDIEGKRRGYPPGWHMITADENNFKSTLAHRLEIQTLNAGGYVIHIEVDNHFDKNYFKSGIIGKIKDLEGVQDNQRFQFYTANSFGEVFQIMKNRLVFFKRFLFDLIKTLNKGRPKDEKLEYNDIYFADLVGPILIVIDSFSGLFSETSVKRENLGDKKVAEDNSDVHELVKLCGSLTHYLGGCVLLNNHYRANIVTNQFLASKAPKRFPFLWRSLRGYLNTSLDITGAYSHNTTSKKKSHKTYYEIYYKWRKLKGEETAKENMKPLKFYVGHGFDIGSSSIEALRIAGFIDDSDKNIEILAENSLSESIPKPINKLVGLYSEKEFKKMLLEDNGKKAKFLIRAVRGRLPQLTPEGIEDKRAYVVRTDKVKAAEEAKNEAAEEARNILNQIAEEEDAVNLEPENILDDG